jgi:hypothetical protein
MCVHVISPDSFYNQFWHQPLALKNPWEGNIMGMKPLRELTRALVITAASAVITSLALADGTETLGDPVGLSLSNGTGYVAAGTGLSMGQPANIDINIPGGATVRQVLLYWEGNSPTPVVVPATATIQVDGGDVTGSFIGGAIGTISGQTQFLTYRADITSLGKVNPGANTVAISGLDFGQNNGAGILAIIDEGGDEATLLLRDGSDRAFVSSPAPMDTTVPQLFTFPGSGVARIATLSMFFADVAGQQSGSTPMRPSKIVIWLGNDLGGAPTMTLSNLLASVDGEEWDTVVTTIEVPAGETMIQVQALSEGAGGTPASFSWITAGLQIPPTPGGGQGCTPGYWRQPHHFFAWTAPYEPTTLFSDVFENAFPGMTLLEVAKQGGGKLKALGRHTVAALLNGASGGVDYDLSAAEVINACNDEYPGSGNDYNSLKNYFEGFNQQGCPLGNGRNDAEITPVDNDVANDDVARGTTTIAASAPSGQSASGSASGGGGATGPGLLLLLAIAAGLGRRRSVSRKA